MKNVKLIYGLFPLFYSSKESALSAARRMSIITTNINKPQIASKMPDTAICYIHC